MAATGHEEGTRELLNAGAKVNAKASNGLTPLHFAALLGHEAVARLLLEGGADLFAKGLSGETPLEVTRYPTLPVKQATWVHCPALYELNQGTHCTPHTPLPLLPTRSP